MKGPLFRPATGIDIRGLETEQLCAAIAERTARLFVHVLESAMLVDKVGLFAYHVEGEIHKLQVLFGPPAFGYVPPDRLDFHEFPVTIEEPPVDELHPTHMSVAGIDAIFNDNDRIFR